MKKLNFITIVASTVCYFGVYGQQHADSTYSSHKKSLSSIPAAVKGSTKNVVFGVQPAVETIRAIKNNTPINFSGREYYYDNGSFFMYNGGRYLLVAPPMGIKIKKVSENGSTFEQVKNDIFYSKGVFYTKKNDGYEVVKNPQGAIVYNLPQLTDVVSIDDEGYYEYLGTLYKRVFVDGEQAFEVVGELKQ